MPSRTSTPNQYIPLIAAGAQVQVRDEEWLVASVQQTPTDGVKVHCIGRSPLVRDTEATFFTNLDVITPLRPEETVLVEDDSPAFRRSRLYLEAVIRKTPVPASETALTVSQHQLLQALQYQRRAARKALTTRARGASTFVAARSPSQSTTFASSTTRSASGIGRNGEAAFGGHR